ncbi:transcriptional attenuator, LytR family [Hathewaya proteolytica DSM 3090]|uniref:Transcriptional attenuator, LytR family n=1 Tax=Hathewaya proteolytica DSM 3090 TaxID=1121331 RepID=A0A1M6LZ08_9CLOT|nr:LCP family protein [Hathewaya proteolytica]SHJ76421.1 transcriptional attenuator, LytR family [Hathewaya proteolytica DSM 3090]
MNRRERAAVIRKKKKKKRRILKAFLILLSITILCMFIVAGVVLFMASRADKKKINPLVPEQNKTVAQEYKNKDIDVYNIALFGLDSRYVNDADDPRSDAIMVVTIDKGRNEIKLSSIIRDTYVEIPGRKGMDKINHAYHFGLLESKEKGPELAVSTINHNFGLTIEDYAAVNFYALRKIIDSIGGLDIELTKDEIENLNEHIRSTAEYEGIKPQYMYKTGKQHLNGLQCVAYCRIRYANGGDYKRSERQRVVLEKMMRKIASMGKGKMLSLINEFLPQIETSLDATEIIGLGMDVMSMDLGKIEQQQFPESWHIDYEEIDRLEKEKRVYYCVCDLKATKKSMLEYIYEDKKPRDPNKKSN